jgi:hypothetical protein
MEDKLSAQGQGTGDVLDEEELGLVLLEEVEGAIAFGTHDPEHRGERHAGDRFRRDLADRPAHLDEAQFGVQREMKRECGGKDFRRKSQLRGLGGYGVHAGFRGSHSSRNTSHSAPRSRNSTWVTVTGVSNILPKPCNSPTTNADRPARWLM